MRYLFPVLIATATLAAAATGATATAGGEDAVAAVYPPWWSRERAAAAAAGADALILGEGVIGSILIIRSGDPETVARLRDHGALLVVTAAGPGGCLPAS